MYSVLIIDDQPLIIEGMRQLIHWEEFGIDTVYDATDGHEGLMLALEKKPDIIITDINMPGMNGLEVAKALKTKNIQSKVILLTGYDSFEYARKAVEYGIIGYILKPAMPEDIAEALRRAVGQCEQQQRQQEKEMEIRRQIEHNMQTIKEAFISELLEKAGMEENEFEQKVRFLGLDMIGCSFRCVLVKIDHYEDFLRTHEEYERQFIQFSLISMMLDQFQTRGNVLNFRNGQAVFLLDFMPGDTAYLSDEKLAPVFEKLIRQCTEQYMLKISFGVGNVAKDYRSIRNSYTQACETLKYTFCFGEGKVIFYNDIIHTQILVPIVELYDRNSLIDNLKMRNCGGVQTVFEQFVQNLREAGIVRTIHIRMVVHELMSVVISTLFNINEDIS